MQDKCFSRINLEEGLEAIILDKVQEDYSGEVVLEEDLEFLRVTIKYMDSQIFLMTEHPQALSRFNC